MKQSVQQDSMRPMGSQIHIETNGYLLRSLVPQDVTSEFLGWLNSPQMMQGLNLLNVSFTAPQLAAFISQFDNRHNYFIGIFDKSNNLLVGFYTIDVNLVHKVGNITTGVGALGYNGKAVLWATIDALLDHFYLYRDLDKMVARILAKNRQMLFCFIQKNTRFVCEAQLKKECLAPSGERVDILLFASFKHNN